MYIIICFLLFVIYKLIKGKFWISKRSIPGNITSFEDHMLYQRFKFAYQHIAENIPKSLKYAPKIIDVGCGVGFGSAILARTHNSIRAIDPQIGATKLNKRVIQRAKKCYPYIDFAAARIEQEPSDTYDVVVSFQTIEHVSNPQSFLKEINRILRTGGTAYISTVNRSYRLGDHKLPWNPDHITEYSQDSFCNLLNTTFQTYSLCGICGNTLATRTELNRVSGSTLHKNVRRYLQTIIYSENRYRNYDTTFFYTEPLLTRVLGKYSAINNNQTNTMLDFLAVCTK